MYGVVYGAGAGAGGTYWSVPSYTITGEYGLGHPLTVGFYQQ